MKRIWLGRVLLFVGALLVGYCVWVLLDARAEQGALSSRLDQVGKDAETGMVPVAWETRHEALVSGLVGRIQIARLGFSAMIVDGDSHAHLRQGVAHLADTAYPGERGNVALAGHRDTYFRPLKDLEEGDVIRITTPDGTFSYEVDSLMIVPPSRGDLVQPSRVPELTLVTCYPFYWVGPAPKRFVVRARPVGVERAGYSGG
jgi:sortase A